MDGHSSGKKRGLSRRVFLRCLGAVLAMAEAPIHTLFRARAWGQVGPPGVPLPDEKVEVTLKRLFGNRSLVPGDGNVKLELPLIAEDGGNVPIAVETSLPLTGAIHVRDIYIISDQNRRPMIAKFSFTPEAGKAYLSTSIRLAMTTDVRAVVEMSDGTLYAAKRHVRVTVSGCDVPSN